ncbi:hypothetical protein KVR01_006650 [Diaporthe batatas]|uniref:uncharacterized protein n=1 Tax=Diaporthe batatas TaxID=748121 RepID=UPI001D052C78|nr:uncharacterized protein KVR01_006650 [Diaporthe batatas]KAG8163353.1 hypothetical protein KVR01_006650 [Diaporthe batatas]
MHHDSSMVVAVATGLGIIGLVSIPALFTLTLHLTARQPRQDTYEDEDGKATPESVAAYSARLPKTLILLFAALACSTGIATAVLATLPPGHDGLFLQDWLGAGASMLLLWQAVAVASCRKTVQAYNLGLYLFFSCLILFVILLVQGTAVFEQLLAHHPVRFAMRILEILAALGLSVASLCIPRRPEIFDRDGKPIDRMYTSTALDRFTWGWPAYLLKMASKRNRLDLDDLPRPDHFTRASELSADWKRRASKRKLWLAIILAHKMALAKQWLLTLITSFLNFGPQWVILQLLRILEKGGDQENFSLSVYMWVLWLGIVIVAQAWIESHVFWLSFAELAIPVRGQVSALIFEKSMRKKDVKGSGRSSNKKAAETADGTAPVIAGPVPESTATDRPEVPEVVEDEAEALKKSKQAVVNLIGVDAKRVSDFMSFQNLFPGSLFKLLVSLAFLVSLLGWKALLAGFSTMVAIMPVNIYFSKRYAAAQDQLMKVRDEKLGIVNEALQGIRQIKFSALEPEWERKISAIREKELKSVWDVFANDTALLGCWVTSPIALAAASLAVYAALYGTLLPSVAFVSLGVFRALEVTLSIIPELTTDVLDAWTSVKRIEEYLDSPEIQKNTKESEEVIFDGASIAWPADEKLDADERFVLRDVTVTFPKGELSVISGKTGTGKSLMLAGILGEVDVLSGSVSLPRPPALKDRKDSKATKANWIIPEAIAYVAQIPWIENASIRDNIEFGLPHDEERYQKTIEVCALKKDLDMLSDGEQTEIGANGINLSGGQKWRVTLARAIYSRAGILVFDDIFSAVDAHVGRHIFEQCLTGELAAGRTRILVTHHVALCQDKTKYLVELGDGKVLHAGLLSELQSDGTLDLIKSHEQTEAEIREDENATAVNSHEPSDEESEGEDEADGNTLKKILSKQDNDPRKFVEDEKLEQGAIKTHVYSVYLKNSGGFWFWGTCVSIFLLNQTLALGRSWWLRIWTGSYEESESVNTFHANASNDHGFAYAVSLQQSVDVHPHAHIPPSMQAAGGHHDLNFYLGIYVALAISTACVATFKFYYTYTGSIRASRELFAKLNFVILRAPLRWLDTVPVGRILNRFTADFHIIDSQLANSISFGGSSLLQLIGVIVASVFVSPYLVLSAFVLLLACLRFALLYLDGARPAKRLESNAKSPVFEQFGSALTGVATIRGFDKAQNYVERMFKKIDDYDTATWHLWLFNRWMGWRMALVGSMFAVIVSLLILLTPGIDAALAGFALAFALEFSNCVVWTIRLYANLELNMNAAERIVEYTELPTETLEGSSPPAAWPTGGSIDVDDLVVGYAPDLPPVLKGLSFSVKTNERIGVVGRTGAGKSSLTLALFRFLEARSGTIHIDGLDISKIKLHDLRSRLAIIPQDPVLFSGTVRSNLDPFQQHDDAELRDSLERVHLISGTGGTVTPVPSSSTDTVNGNSNVFNDLTSPISEGGLNLSQGQRQLLCLARAIVGKPKVLVLDEATSAVDMATDALIQRSIREEFTDATLVVIAHRLSTIADFDRILVLGDGRVAEYGTPRDLWERDGGRGVFRGMCEESGEKDRLRRIVFGQ